MRKQEDNLMKRERKIQNVDFKKIINEPNSKIIELTKKSIISHRNLKKKH